ncbi:MAG: hypothetical protein AB8B56_22085 [Crocinitomicaceae bacterium]
MEINTQTIETKKVGNSNAKSFFSPRGLQSITLFVGSTIDAIVINGVRLGGDGGSQIQKDDKDYTFFFKENEYIVRLAIQHGDGIDNIDFTTNFGHSFSGGGKGGHTLTTFIGEIIAFGGQYGDRLDVLTVAGNTSVTVQKV